MADPAKLLIEDIFRLAKEVEQRTGVGMSTSLASLQGIERDLMKLASIRDELYDIVAQAKRERRAKILSPLVVAVFGGGSFFVGVTLIRWLLP